MLKLLNLAHLGILIGILYWPAEAMIHSFIFKNGHFIDNLYHSDANEIWMRILISSMFIGFGIYARKSVLHQQHLQQHINKERNRLHQIIDSSYDAYISIDQHSMITGWNLSAEKLFGWPKPHIMGKKLDVIIPTLLRHDHHKGMQHYQQNSIGPWLYKPVYTKALHHDGFELAIELVVTPITSDGEQEFFAFIREQKSNR